MIHEHLHQRTGAAVAAYSAATNPIAKAIAKRELLVVKEQLEAAQREDAFTQVFKATPRQSAFGAWLTKEERDRPIFFLGRAGTKLKGVVELPNGQKVQANVAGQVAVPLSMADAMVRRGYVRVNDEGKMPLDPLLPPVRNPNSVA
jgi:hypothetical protein